jgi:phosphatidylglycerol:prolipoprotein diacylglycerol transferase
MPLLVIPFPEIDPVLIEIGPLAIRWYALAYIAGLVIGWRYMARLSRRPGAPLDEGQIDDMLFWITIGVVLGGRLGYVLFYNPGYYLANPGEALMVWRGGMSFHGGLLGVFIAIIWFCRRRRLPLLAVGDVTAQATPIGLFLGRIANFINAELFGRPSDVPWAMVFPTADDQPRHPSQIYEALLEGLVLFVLLWLLARKAPWATRPGFLTGAFCVGYAVARAIVELFREPDAHIGFLAGSVTMGQVLSLPLLLFGLYLMVRARSAEKAA